MLTVTQTRTIWAVESPHQIIPVRCCTWNIGEENKRQKLEIESNKKVPCEDIRVFGFYVFKERAKLKTGAMLFTKRYILQFRDQMFARLQSMSALRMVIPLDKIADKAHNIFSSMCKVLCIVPRLLC